MSLMNRKLGAIKIGHWLNLKKLHFLLLVGLAMNVCSFGQTCFYYYFFSSIYSKAGLSRRQ